MPPTVLIPFAPATTIVDRTPQARDFSRSLMHQPIRSAGMLVPVFSLRRDGDLGIGDTAAVIEHLDLCARAGISILQALPVGECDTSPYDQSASFAFSPLYATFDEQKVPGFRTRFLERVDTTKLAAASMVDYNAVRSAKMPLFWSSFQEFLTNEGKPGTALHAEFETFKRTSGSALDSYTLYRSLVDCSGGQADWEQWKPGWRNPAAAAAAIAKDGAFGKEIATSREFHAYVQWVMTRQWTEVKTHATRLGIELKGDLNYGVSRASCDVWANNSLFELDWSGGAPPEDAFKPDRFTAKWGQNWGNSPYAWDAHVKEEYAWWNGRLNRTLCVFHCARFDHAHGAFRQYVFPWQPSQNALFTDLTPAEAAERCGGRSPMYRPGSEVTAEGQELNRKNGTDFFTAMLATAQACGGGLSAEALGVVPDYARRAFALLGIPTFSVPLLDDRELVDPARMPEVSVLASSTHDHPSMGDTYSAMMAAAKSGDHAQAQRSEHFARFVSRDAADMPTEYDERMHQSAVWGFLRSHPRICVLSAWDIFGLPGRVNLPGTVGSHNWTLRLPTTAKGLESDATYGKKLEFLTLAIQRSDRDALNGVKA